MAPLSTTGAAEECVLHLLTKLFPDEREIVHVGLKDLAKIFEGRCDKTFTSGVIEAHLKRLGLNAGTRVPYKLVLCNSSDLPTELRKRGTALIFLRNPRYVDALQAKLDAQS